MIEKALWFRNICLTNGFEVDAEKIRLLSEYVTLLLQWNKHLNLISRKDEENIWENHILHCASLALMVDFPPECRIVDIGTGGGLPGIVLKILRPDLEFLLIDATKKKIDAVEKMLTTLQLQKISSRWGRVEEISRLKEFQGSFDFAIARAVAELPKLVVWATPLLRKASQGEQRQHSEEGKKIIPHVPALLALKGGELSREILATQRKYPSLRITEYPLQLSGAESLHANQKKIVYLQFI